MAFIHPSLLTLAKLRLRGTRRRILRGARTPKGRILFALGVVMFGLWLAPSIVAAFMRTDAHPETLHTVFPFIILAMCTLTMLTSAGERAIYFHPAEVDLLFPGPFSRRELLAYKVMGGLVSTAFSALIFSIIFLRWGGWWPALYVGLFLSFQFVQLLSMSVMLIGQMMAEQAFTRIRKTVMLIVMGILAVALWRAVSAQAEQSFTEILARARDSAALRIVFLPLEPFACMVSAQTLFPNLVGWAAVAVAINAALFAVIVGLDAQYTDAAVGISQKVYSRLQRARRSGVSSTSKKEGRTVVPRLPWLGGAGPIARRQCINATRNARGLVVMLCLMGIFIGAPLVTRSDHIDDLLPFAGLMMLWLTVILSMMIRFDFRMDLEQMEWLKMMPLRPASIFVGELVVPVIMTTFVQLALFGLLAYLQNAPIVLLYVVLFGVPINALLFGAENIMFLLYPSRVVAFSPGDFQLFGRQVLLMLAKMILVLLFSGLAACFGGLLHLLTGSQVVFILGAWVFLLLEAAAIVPVGAWAYRRYDVSTETPA